MTVIEALLSKTRSPGGGLTAIFGARKPQRHRLPGWAAQQAKKRARRS